MEGGEPMFMAERSGTGKSALLVSTVSYVARSTETGVFSAEMPSAQLTCRNISQGWLSRASYRDGTIPGSGSFRARAMSPPAAPLEQHLAGG
jgi:hypothetical protein